MEVVLQDIGEGVRCRGSVRSRKMESKVQRGGIRYSEGV